jgi:hypothetical protein
LRAKAPTLPFLTVLREEPMSETFVHPSGLADGMTNFDGVRRLECFIEMTRNLAASSGPIVNLSGLSQICTQQKKAPGDAGA